MTIPITKPVFGEEELRAVQAPIEAGWVVQGPQVARFEQRFAEFTGVGFAAASSSCTTALHMAVAALGLKPGDEVIVPAFTWISTANVVEYMGAKPVFCDVSLETFNIDAAAIEAHVTDRTVGIIPVHLFGLCADMDAVGQLARDREVWVVEDAACAFGAWHRGRHAGTMGDVGCFSFHPRKSITTGEGGMFTTMRPELDRLARILRDHGASRSDLQRHEADSAFLLAEYEHLGYNYRLTDLQAALGNAQMDRAEWILGRRAEIAQRYNELLADAEWFRPQAAPAESVHGYQAYVGLFCPEEPTLQNAESLHRFRNRLMRRLEQQDIATRQGTHAPVALGYYARRYEIELDRFPNAFLADRLTLTLPLYPQLTDEEQDQVVAALRSAFEEG